MPEGQPIDINLRLPALLDLFAHSEQVMQGFTCAINNLLIIPGMKFYNINNTVEHIGISYYFSLVMSQVGLRDYNKICYAGVGYDLFWGIFLIDQILKDYQKIVL